MSVIVETEGCPLCGSGDAVARGGVPYREIWDGLRRDWAAEFSEEVVTRHTPAEVASLVECGGCGLRYFVPKRAGDADFYREISLSPLYYAPDKWEFGVVAATLGPEQEVLDVGCGDGRFLEQIHRGVRRAVGIETNPEAVSRARGRGLDVREHDLFAFAAENAATFDVVTSFHVLEHLTDIRPFLRAMVDCLRPGGTLIVSVPYRDRILQGPGIEHLDCPPHHVSRWDARQFEAIADLTGIDLSEVTYQPPDMHALRSHVKQVLGRAAGPGRPLHLGGLGTFASRALARVTVSAPLYALYRRLGWLESPRLCRLTMVARFRKPS